MISATRFSDLAPLMASLVPTTPYNLGVCSLPNFRSSSIKSAPVNLRSSTRSNVLSHQNENYSLPNPLKTPYLGFLSSNLSPKLLNYALSLSNQRFTVRSSASTIVVPAEPWQGASLKPLMASMATGIILWFVPIPTGVTKNVWQLLTIFLATIVGIITQPLPCGAVALMGLGASILTKTLTFGVAFSAFGDPIPWLIALAFFFAQGFIKIGLGN